ncbi:MAG: ATP-binding protein [bacterium]|nr:ATP-binding protein [bacterium]
MIDDLKASFEFPVEIIFEDNGEWIQIQADGNLLLGIFHNLIKNAVEHVSDLDDLAARMVRVGLTRESEHMVVSIHNGGAPIPDNRLASFFEKFNTHGKLGGTGLSTTYAALVTRARGGKSMWCRTRQKGRASRCVCSGDNHFKRTMAALLGEM